VQKPGSIIFLNGTSSAGKTTLAHALQDKLEQPFQHMALDQFRDGLPAKYRGLNAPAGTTGANGLNVVPVNSGDRTWTEVRFGPVGERVLRGMRRSIVTMADAGNNIIIDDILLSSVFLDDYLSVMTEQTIYFVGVRCPLPVIARREATRLGRFPGTAESHFERCHAHRLYDVEVDTSAMSPEACAIRVIERMEMGPPAAFGQLRDAAKV
jgi:chloramphenicol 3-O phosphotransferase